MMKKSQIRRQLKVKVRKVKKGIKNDNCTDFYLF